MERCLGSKGRNGALFIYLPSYVLPSFLHILFFAFLHIPFFPLSRLLSSLKEGKKTREGGRKERKAALHVLPFFLSSLTFLPSFRPPPSVLIVGRLSFFCSSFLPPKLTLQL